MDEQSQQNDPWQKCPDNTVGSMLNSQEKLKRRQMITTMLIGGGVSITALAVGTWGLVNYGSPSKGSGPIGCGVVCKHLNEYIAGTISDQKLAQQIKQHLSYCASCETKRQQLLSRQT